MTDLKPLSRIAAAMASLLLLSGYFLPIWQILMWAPQYPEGLEMKIWINNITGDVKIISALNHYIGMKHIDVSMFPEFSFMVYILAAVIAVGLITAILRKRFLLVIFCTTIAVTGIAALADFYRWGYDYGHNLDPTAPIIVPDMSYQPPLIGTKQLLNFTAFSGPDIGGWIFLAAGLLAGAALFFEVDKIKIRRLKTAFGFTIAIIVITACGVPQPEALRYGRDACDACRMTLMDRKFGAEIVTKKGKIYRFDDLNCLVGFLGNNIEKTDVALVLATDFTTGVLTDVRGAFYLRSGKIASPMTGNTAAFALRTSLDSCNAVWNGQVVTWDEVSKQFTKASQQ